MATRRTSRVRELGTATAVAYVTALVAGFFAFALLAVILLAVRSLVGGEQHQSDWLLVVELALLAVPSAAVGHICGSFVRDHLHN